MIRYFEKQRAEFDDSIHALDDKEFNATILRCRRYAVVNDESFAA